MYINPHLLFALRLFRWRLGDGVSAVDTDISACHVQTGIAGEKRDGSHEVFRYTHLADWDQASPLLRKSRVVVENLLGPVTVLVMSSNLPQDSRNARGTRGCETYNAVSM